MLRIWCDILLAAETRQVTLLGLLDLSAAFDCVDNALLLQRLEIGVGLSGVVLDWIRSFLTDRTQQVACSGRPSPVSQLMFGVPQGSVLGPLLDLRSIHSRTGLRGRTSPDVSTSVRRRRSNLRQDASRACLSSGR